jgi:hypothetical protein
VALIAFLDTVGSALALGCGRNQQGDCPRPAAEHLADNAGILRRLFVTLT